MELCDERLHPSDVNAATAELILAGVPAPLASLGVIQPSDLALPGVTIHNRSVGPGVQVNLPAVRHDPRGAGGITWSVDWASDDLCWFVSWGWDAVRPDSGWANINTPEAAARVLANILAYARHAANAKNTGWEKRAGVAPLAARMLLLTPADLARDDCQVGSDGSVTLLDPDGSPRVAVQVGKQPAPRRRTPIQVLLHGSRRQIFRFHTFGYEGMHVGLESVAWRTRTKLWGCEAGRTAGV